MSVQAITWALQVRAGGPSRKAVLLAIANYANEDGVCWPSHGRLADDTEMCVRSVGTIVRELEDAGLLLSERRNGAGGHRTANQYRLPLTAKVAARRGGQPANGSSQQANCSRPNGNCLPNRNRHEPSEEPLAIDLGKRMKSLASSLRMNGHGKRW